MSNWQKALEACLSEAPQLPAGVCLGPTPIHLRFSPRVGKNVGHWLLLGFTWLNSPDSSSEMLPKPWQGQLLGLPKGLTGFTGAMCGFWHLLASVWGSAVGVFCCCDFLGLSAGRLS